MKNRRDLNINGLLHTLKVTMLIKLRYQTRAGKNDVVDTAQEHLEALANLYNNYF